MNTGFLGPAVATVLTVYGIETHRSHLLSACRIHVATVLTVYGIETGAYKNILNIMDNVSCNSTYRLRY